MSSSDVARVVPTDHSLERMSERASAMAPGELVRLIEESIAAGRTSRRRPRCVRERQDEARVARKRWAWSEGRELVFPLHERPGGVLVAATVLRRDHQRSV